VTWIAAQTPGVDFWLAAGDDRTDEDMFARAPEGGWTVHVGPGPTGSNAIVPDSHALIDLLDAMQRTTGNP
jgi:trehalose 6-phosphate synthase/phosphatase